MKDSEENDPDKITLNTLFSQLKKLEEIILDQKDLKDLKDLKEAKEAKEAKDGEFKLEDNQDIEEKFEKYPDNIGRHSFRLNRWVLQEFLQLVRRKRWKIQTSITKAMLLFIDHYENAEDEINENN